MSTENNNINNNEEPELQNGRVQVGQVRFVIGILTILIGVYAALASISYLFSWKADCSMLAGLVDIRPDEAPTYANFCGGLGARVGNLLIGRSFGLSGLIIPLYLLILGMNILNGSRRLILNRDSLTMSLVLLLSSLTLGAIFGSSWDLFASGLGGAFGVEVSHLLYELIGIGTILVIIGAWIALGVYINVNFINVVNKAGSSALNNTHKIFDRIKRKEQIVPNEPQREQEVTPEVNLEDLPNEVPVVEQPQYENKYREEVKIDEDEVTFEENYDNSFTINDMYNTPKVEIQEDNSTPEFIEERVVTSQPVVPTPEPIAPEEENEDDDNPFIEVLGNITIPEVEQPAPFIDEAEVEDTEGIKVFVEVNEVKEVDESEIESSLYDPTLDLNSYTRPSPSLLEDYQVGVGVSEEEIFDNKSKIEETLDHFGIPIQQHIKATVGPTITLYEIIQANGVKISKIQGLENDIAQRLKALGIRIIAPIPGAGTIGVELPNRTKQIVSMRSAILSKEFQDVKAQLPIVIGRTIQNENYVFDLAKMPHLLVAGATGQGKSVGLNAIITSLLYSKHPSELKFVMIDPKMVEFTPYRRLEKHFMAKMESEDDVIITDPKKAVYALNSICVEMENRLKLLSEASVRNIVEYNEKFTKRRLSPEKGHFFMPYIVVVIDEFADLIMTAKEVEMPVMRIAQKARAVGIHLIIATQRPDVKVITGGIKANFPARIAFKVTQMIDSRTIIDQPGANQLIGRGDMLFSKDGELTRIQCALVDTDEVVRIVDHIGSQQGYSNAYNLPDYTPESGSGDFDMGGGSSPEIKYDSLFAEIARAAVSNGGISTSAIQRNFEVGFNRAGRIMTQLERSGIVGKQEGSKPREILFYDLPSLESKLQDLGLF